MMLARPLWLLKRIQLRLYCLLLMCTSCSAIIPSIRIHSRRNALIIYCCGLFSFDRVDALKCCCCCALLHYLADAGGETVAAAGCLTIQQYSAASAGAPSLCSLSLGEDSRDSLWIIKDYNRHLPSRLFIGNVLEKCTRIVFFLLYKRTRERDQNSLRQWLCVCRFGSTQSEIHLLCVPILIQHSII